MSEPIVKVTWLKVAISTLPIFAGVVIRLLDKSIGVDASGLTKTKESAGRRVVLF